MLAVMRCGGGVELLLWLAAVFTFIWGVFSVFTGNVLMGIVLFIVAALIGPGGISLFC